MKNSANLGFILLLLMILGCACPKLNDLGGGDNRATNTVPVSTPVVANKTSDAPKTTGGDSTISLAKYNQLKDGMSYSEAVNILGSEGNEVSSSEIGKMKIATYKWDGANYAFVILTFQNDKIMSKSQANLK